MSLRTSIEELHSFIAKDSSQAAQSVFEECLAKDPSEFLHQVRVQGCFRFSKYDFKVYKLTKLLKFIDTVPLNSDWQAYISSVKALQYMASSVRGLYTRLEKHLAVFNAGRIKEMLACVESYWLKKVSAMPGDNPGNLVGWFADAERLTECFSFYVYHATKNHQFTHKDLGLFLEQNIVDGSAFNILTSIAPILAFQEIEMMVDHFGYSAKRDRKRVIIRASEEIFEKSICYSFASSGIARLNTGSRSWHEYKNAQSLEEAANHIFRKVGKTLIRLKASPERLVIEFPDTEEFLVIFTAEEYYREELSLMSITQKEFLITHDEFRGRPIYKDLTLLDVLRFQRFFKFFLAGLICYFKEHGQPSDVILYRSIVPVMKMEDLRKNAERVMSAKKAEDLIELIVWRKESKGVFDAQYKPIIAAGEYCLVPFHLLGQSNLLRNILVAARFRFDSEGDVDPVTEAVKTALLEKDFKTIKGFNYSHRQKRGEIDLLAYKDAFLFVFECKSSLSPTGPAELRTSFDYISKGRRQLDQFTGAMANEQFRSSVAKRFNLDDFPRDVKVSTCIVMGNRMFTGYTSGTHPVRPLYSLINFIDSGEVAFSDGEVNFWKSPAFSVSDLAAYVEQNTLDGPLMALMDPWERVYPINGKELVFESFSLDFSKISAALFAGTGATNFGNSNE